MLNEKIPFDMNENLDKNSAIDNRLLDERNRNIISNDNDRNIINNLGNHQTDDNATQVTKQTLMDKFNTLDNVGEIETTQSTKTVDLGSMVSTTPAVVKETIAPNINGTAKAAEIDISDIPIDDSDSYSSVLGNLDDDEPSEFASKINEIHKEDFNFYISDKEIDFSKEEIDVDTSVEEALKEEVVEQSKNDEKYIYHSYADNKVSTRRPDSKLSFLDNITVDLKNVTITKKSPIEQTQDINLVFDNNIATFTVICCQSGYKASMSGLTLSEKNAINNSDGDIFEMRQKLYKVVYNKIQSMSIPKPDFNNWLKITSFNDLSTLLFGIYCQTFIDNNDFDITCGRCQKTTPVTVNNLSLVEVRDRATYAKRDEIIESIKTGEELVAASIVHKDERVILDDSKIIVDVATPSLHDHLSLLKKSNQKTLQEYADTFSAMLFISHLYMLDIKETYNTGRASYYEIEDPARILNILLKLSNRDGEQLENAIQEKLGKYQINYEIHNVTCSHCGTQLPGIPVDIENILFTRINRTNEAT